MLYEKLNYVMTIAEERNLTRAAKKLFISQPALTLYLNRLEEELGVKLFDRTKTPLEITPAGAYYIEQMEPIYLAEHRLRNNIKTLAEPAGTLTIGIGQVRGFSWLPVILPEFCEKHPDINVEVKQIQEKKMIPMLKTDDMDAAFGVFPAPSGNLVSIELFQEKLLLAAHKSFHLIPEEERDQYSAESPYLLEVEKLNGLPLICPSFENGLYLSYENIMDKNKIVPGRIISISNMLTGYQLARLALGVQLLSAFVTTMIEDSDVPDSDMDFCLIPNMPALRTCTATYMKGNIKEDQIKELIEIIREKVL